MELEQIPILELIPQRPPFVMVDKLVAFDRIHTTTRFTIRPDCIFVADGKMELKGIVENVAQTCATRMGYINYIEREHVKLGFIGAIRNMNFTRQPLVGEVLTTEIIVREEVFRMTLVDAAVRIGEEIIATAEMKIALSEIDAKEEV